MAKWDEELAGSSLHVHMSLTDAARRAALPRRGPLAGTPVRASETFRWFLGGLLGPRAGAHPVVFAPNVNSYKRFRPGTFAPTGIAWSYDNRTAGFRVVGQRPLAAHRVPHPGSRREPLPGVRGAAGGGARRDRAPDRARARLRGRRLRGARVCPACRAAWTRRSRPSSAATCAREAFGDAVVDALPALRPHASRTPSRRGSRDVERERYFERI